MTNPTSTNNTDIPNQSWLDLYIPSTLKPYCRLARLDRPIGTWLLLLPCWWGLALASPGWPNPFYVCLFGLGALVMRGAGCTINDLVDKDFDIKVARTSTRPIASGDISVLQALLFLVLQMSLGFLILIQLNTYTIWLGISSLCLIVIYPFMKRITYWPQACLGLVFNWGVLVGWTTITGELSAAPFIMYVGGFFWTLGYDTIYAHQDKSDDILLGVKSTALKFGNQSKLWISVFYVISLSLIGASGYIVSLAWPFFVGIVICAFQLAWQVKSLDIDDPKKCLRRFKSNRDFGLILFIAIVAAHMT
jgi:4-hydroxybenzoate polyprenyltransferase